MSLDPNSPQLEEVCEEVINGNGKTRRHAALIATFGLLMVAGGATAGFIYDVVVNGNGSSMTQLGTLATLALGGLLAISGSKQKGE